MAVRRRVGIREAKRFGGSFCLSLSFGWLLGYSAQNADICFDGDAPSADTASSASVAAHLLLLVTLLGVGIPQPPPPTAGIKVVEPSLLHLGLTHESPSPSAGGAAFVPRGPRGRRLPPRCCVDALARGRRDSRGDGAVGQPRWTTGGGRSEGRGNLCLHYTDRMTARATADSL